MNENISRAGIRELQSKQLFHVKWHSWLWYVCQYIILIFNYLLVKIIKNGYFKNIHRDEFNNILYDIIYFYILVKKNMIKVTYVNS